MTLSNEALKNRARMALAEAGDIINHPDSSVSEATQAHGVYFTTERYVLNLPDGGWTALTVAKRKPDPAPAAAN